MRRTSLVALLVLVVLAASGWGRGGSVVAASAPGDPGIHFLYADGVPGVWPTP